MSIKKLKENMSCINYIDEESNERLYDTHTLRTRLRMSKSRLTQALNKYNFTTGDYIVYKNQFLFKESVIVNFIESIVMKKQLTDRRKINNEGLNQIREAIKEYMRKYELREN